jgi:glycosyltransferase involved in cell wall biosynthesis
MLPKLSLIISFYNKTGALLLVLEALRYQSMKEFEVIIADDGSGEETVRLIHEKTGDCPFPLRHIWHTDRGWRKNEILNKAILAAQTDYLVFIDGDCIPEKHFLEEHYLNRQAGAALSGRRVNMGERLTRHISVEEIRKHQTGWQFKLRLFMARLFRAEGNHVENAIYIRSQWLRKKIYKENKGILGCNFSIHKKDILSINGFDERYQSAFVGEDTDLEMRFLNAGGKTISVKHKAIVFHCWHKRMVNDLSNLEIYNKSKDAGLSYTPFGIVKNT